VNEQYHICDKDLTQQYHICDKDLTQVEGEE